MSALCHRGKPITSQFEREALAEPEFFDRILQGQFWYAWRTLLVAASGEEPTTDERPRLLRRVPRRQPARRRWPCTR